ncbi:energy transducer TonB [Mucilaginibacter terrae]|uniref:Protein TonB n=1 Tax=Mucilaginibacter terrae TaxID=1955052 RepID=A0ABU3GNS6_9SPHI|nr:TonB family protein [Mucilaginibacter terrae]MDT3401412.1 protein TonB [Mucilaginibacter terrae]
MLNQKFDLYKSEWLDLVFTDRNKSYGAYDLRVHYGETMMKALAITVLGFTLTAGVLTYIIKNRDVERGPIEVDLSPKKYTPPPVIEKPKDPVIEKPHKAAQATKPAAVQQNNVASQRFVEPVPTNDPVIDNVKPIDPGKVISTIDNKGVNTQPITNTTTTVTPGGGIGQGNTQNDGDGSKTFDINGVEVMPEPYGGNAAWAKFLQKNLRYPDTDVQGRVMLSFIIEKDGKLSDIQILKGISPELDREALRVLKLAPAWKPGMQNGHAVRVKYTIPIVFQMADN